MFTHQPPLYRVGAFHSSCTPFCWRWSQVSIEMFPPSSSYTRLLALEKYRNWREDCGADWAWREMMGQFDLVLQVKWSTDCMSEVDYQEEKEERKKEAKGKGVELPDTNVVVSERFCECYRKLGVKMEGFWWRAFRWRSIIKGVVHRSRVLSCIYNLAILLVCLKLAPPYCSYHFVCRSYVTPRQNYYNRAKRQ